MISVVIPTLNAADRLAPTLSCLVQAAADGLVRDVIVSDGGSRDDTLLIADAMGCTIVAGPAGRGTQLAAGAAIARGPWLLFLHADTVLIEGWERDVRTFIERAETGRRDLAATFTFALDSFAWQARLMEQIVSLRCLLFALPYGDQGLLIRQAHYRQIGGFRALPLMEDVDIIRRLGRRSLVQLRSKALTSAARYEGDGYFRRSLHNLSCLFLYMLGMPAEKLVRRYENRLSS